MKINEKKILNSIDFILVFFIFVFVFVKCIYINMLKDKESCGGCV